MLTKPTVPIDLFTWMRTWVPTDDDYESHRKGLIKLFFILINNQDDDDDFD